MQKSNVAMGEIIIEPQHKKATTIGMLVGVVVSAGATTFGAITTADVLYHALNATIKTPFIPELLAVMIDVTGIAISFSVGAFVGSGIGYGISRCCLNPSSKEENTSLLVGHVNETSATEEDSNDNNASFTSGTSFTSKQSTKAYLSETRSVSENDDAHNGLYFSLPIAGQNEQQPYNISPPVNLTLEPGVSPKVNRGYMSP